MLPQRIAHHPMQAISIVSGGDLADYIAYVAKDVVNQRACYILKCPQGRAGEVINSLHQAFETPPRPDTGHTSSVCSTSTRSTVNMCEHHDYYNLIPEKMPPIGGIEDVRIRWRNNQHDAEIQAVYSNLPVSLCEKSSFTEETPAPPAELSAELWFHGRLGREQAELLLTCSGDFLVRESTSASGEFVLSGREEDTVWHLLLVDPHGQVRTQDRLFLSVGHLVRFHMEKQVPINFGNRVLCLKQAVIQRHSQTHS